MICLFFFFNESATTEIYTLSLHDALPILTPRPDDERLRVDRRRQRGLDAQRPDRLLRLRRVDERRADADPRDATERGDSHARQRSEEHTSELQSRQYLVCRLLLEKKKSMHHCRSKHIRQLRTL